VPDVGETLAHYELVARAEDRDGPTSEGFDAIDTRTGGPVLLEVLRQDATSVEKARFGLRGRRLKALQHPALVATLDSTPTYAAFEPVPEATLRSLAGLAIARARQKLSFLSQVASALALLHKNGLIHGGIGLDAIALDGGKAKLFAKHSADLSGTPLDDVRAFAVAACELVLGAETVGEFEPAVAERLHEAGLPKEAAAILARVQAGASMTSEDLAQKLAPFGDYAGPGTEPLLPVARKSSP
jgi:serine/threonine protein kinase